MPSSSPATVSTPVNDDFNNITSISDAEQSATTTNNHNGKVKKPKAAAPPEPVPPPDGGWGWMVVLSSFMVSLLVDGVCFTTGVFFNTFRLHFGTSKGQTAWVGSVLNGSYLTVGPLVSACVNKYGCRPVAMFGAVFAGVAFFISTFSPSMNVLIVTFGFLGGLGFGFVYLPAIVMVGYYFEKRRALATGIACCGSGLGAFIFAPLCNFLLEEYGWKGATWILSGLVLNSLVFSIFYRPLEHKKMDGDGGEAGERLLRGDDNDEEEAVGKSKSGPESSGATASAAGVDVDVASSQSQPGHVTTAGVLRKEDVQLLLSGKKGSSREERTKALLGGNNEHDEELLLRGEAVRKAMKGKDRNGAAAKLSASVGDLQLSSSSSHSPFPHSDQDSSTPAGGEGSKRGDGVSETNMKVESAPPTATSSSLCRNGSTSKAGKGHEGHESKGSNGNLSLEMALEQNGNVHPALRNMIQTVTPEIHRVSSEESKAFMSDFKLQESNPIARMAFSQDMFSLNPLAKRHHNRHHHHHSDHHHSHNYLDVDNPLQRKDIFYSGSLRNIPEYQSAHSLAEYRQRVVTSLCEDLDTSGSTKKGSDDDEGSVGSCDEESLVSSRGFLARVVYGPLLRVFDVSLLKSPTFDIYCLSCLLCMLGFFVPFIYLPTLCIELGISASKAALIISIIGIANTVGRVVVGFVSDQPWADSLIINNVALVLGGVATACVPFLHVYPLFATYAFIFGSCIAIFVSLRSIIMVELMGLQKLTNAFGLVIMCQGISSFIGAPIAGLLSDMTGDYNISFYVAGITIGLSGIICFPLRRVATWEQEREQRRLEEAVAMRRRKSKST